MGAAAIGIVGLGLSAASTVSAMKQQSDERARQNALIDNNLLELEDRLTLARMHNKAVKEGAAQLRAREQQIINSQKVQSQLAIREQELQNQLAIRQAELAASGVEAQAEIAAAQTIAAANDEYAGILSAASNEIEQASQLAVGEATSGGSRTSVANQSRATDRLITLQNRLAENADQAKGISEINRQYAQDLASNQLGLSGVQSGYIRDTIENQRQSDELYGPFARRQTRLTARRNQLASRGAQFTREASADMSLLSQEMATSYQRNALEAQRPSGGGQFLNAALGVATQGISLASNLGLFNPAPPGSTSSPTRTSTTYGFGSNSLGTYSGSFNTQFIDNPVGIAGTSKSNLGIKPTNGF